MKFEAVKITKVLEQNFTHLMRDFYEMQTEYLASLNIIYDDLDASLVAMVLTNQLYKNTIEGSDAKDKISFKNFYQKNNFNLPVAFFRIKEISSIINLPRETVRRKKEKLIKDKIILIDKRKKLYTLNSEKVDRKILELQIHNLSKFLSKFSNFFNKNNVINTEISREQIKKDVDEKFLIYLTKFLDFQIAYFSNLKNIMDIESIFIVLLCNLNTLSAKENLNEKPLNLKDTFYKFHKLSNITGLNATSISEITKIPRTTVLRKIANLEKNGILKKDKYKRYSSDNLTNSNESKKIFSAVEYNLKILGIFFSQCLETYVDKKLTI